MRRAVRALNQSRLRYALTGALAVSYYGRPRTTMDIDVLVVAKESELARPAKALTERALRTETNRLHQAWRSKYGIATVSDSKLLRRETATRAVVASWPRPGKAWPGDVAMQPGTSIWQAHEGG